MQLMVLRLLRKLDDRDEWKKVLQGKLLGTSAAKSGDNAL